MRINLLPKEYRPQPLVNPIRLILMIIGSTLFVSALGAIVYFYLQIQKNDLMIADYQQKLDSYQSYKLELDSIDQRLQTIKKYQDEVAGISKLYPPYPGYIKTISEALPEDVWLTDVKFAENKITIKGNSLSFSMIGQFLKHIKSVSFQSVRLISVNEIKESESSLTFFEFSIEIETKEGGVKYGQSKNP